MSQHLFDKLSRRERQIMDILYRTGHATAAEVRISLPDPPTNTAVRTMLSILEDKGFIKHTLSAKRFIYSPVIARERAGKSALKHLVRTFFDGSANSVIATLMDVSKSKLTDEEYEDLTRLIEKTRKQRK